MAKDCPERFKTHNADEVHELRIKNEPDAYEEQLFRLEKFRQRSEIG